MNIMQLFHGVRPRAVAQGDYLLKLAAAKAFLGERWVLHPNYNPNHNKGETHAARSK